MAIASVNAMTAEEKKLIYFSSLSALVAWYDFYLCGVLAATIGRQFFPTLAPNAQYICALLVFAAGFLARPLGALFFDQLARLIGSKSTFFVTTLLMGLSTFLMGCLPNYESIGVAAPVLLVVLRLLQGLALGGEYGGAATYIVEHAPPHRRGAHSSWIQMTATLGFMLSLVAVLASRYTQAWDFHAWGWRVPFFAALVLLALTAWIRLSLRDVPTFQKMQSEERVTRTPVMDSLRSKHDLKLMTLALLGLTAGQAVVWYAGQFYALFFLSNMAKVDSVTANLLVAAALIIGVPFFIFFGALSDKIGGKVIIMSGCLLAALSYFMVFPSLLEAANPALAKAQKAVPVVVIADPASCSAVKTLWAPELDALSACDQTKRTLIQNFIPYQMIDGPADSDVAVQFGSAERVVVGELKTDLLARAKAKGLLQKADLMSMNHAVVLGLLVFLVILVAMVYGPLAVMLSDFFPPRMRYTSMNLPYHIGNGWFGGLLPPIIFAMVALTGDIFYGLWYPVVVALLTVVIGLLVLPKHQKLEH